MIIVTRTRINSTTRFQHGTGLEVGAAYVVSAYLLGGSEATDHSVCGCTGNCAV
jgi:hypothetical protein